MKSKLIFSFLGKLLISLFVVYVIQYYIYDRINVESLSISLQLSYLINGLLAVVIFAAIIFLMKKHKDQLGFLYMFGSLLKFGVFFIVFNPIFKEDGVLTRVEFAIFFVPYIVSLTVETIELIGILNAKEAS